MYSLSWRNAIIEKQILFDQIQWIELRWRKKNINKILATYVVTTTKVTLSNFAIFFLWLFWKNTLFSMFVGVEGQIPRLSTDKGWWKLFFQSFWLRLFWDSDNKQRWLSKVCYIKPLTFNVVKKAYFNLWKL